MYFDAVLIIVEPFFHQQVCQGASHDCRDNDDNNKFSDKLQHNAIQRGTEHFSNADFFYPLVYTQGDEPNYTQQHDDQRQSGGRIRRLF